jgi:4-hydroxybenzoate polyprenyltransferase
MAGMLESLLRIARFWNLAIIALAQYFTVAFLVDPHLVLDWRLLALSVSTVTVAAAGYIINDYYDVKIDLINKPERVVIGKSISRRYAILMHSWLSIFGVAVGTALNWKIGAVNFFSAFLLWLYSNNLKRQPFIGNLAIGFLTGMSILIVILLYPFAAKTNIVIYATFAFFMTLVREIIKDIEDLKGDNTFGCKTLPILFGIRRAKQVVYALTVAFIVTVFAIHFRVEPLPMTYFSVLLFGPVAWLLIRLVRADTRKDFEQLSVLCKVIMIFGVLSMAAV